MSSTSFAGFPRGVRLLPVPAPLLGSLLAEIDDIAELKCTLRFLWYAAQVKGTPKSVPAAALETDEVLLSALGCTEAVCRGLGLAVTRGTLLAANGALLLNTPDNARHVSQIGGGPASATLADTNVTSAHAKAPKPNIYGLYEANIGLLTPMIAEQLRDAEETYPEEWIEGAFREAVEQNKRSWRYIVAILERWTTEGRGIARQGAPQQKGWLSSGEPRGHSEKVTAAEYLRRRKPSD